MVKLLIVVVFAVYSNCGYCQQDSIQEMGYPFEEVPKFNGDIRLFVQKSIVYPISAIADSIEGKVFVKYLVDTSGFTTGHVIEKGIRDDLNNEAIRVARLIKYDSPAKLRGKSVLFYYTLPIEFKLPSKDVSSNHALTKKKCKK
ncbi:MAG: energy transducer TonB [Bacteroidales bacterium]|nr:energy transducer TonB [Bacteroidales bacterium]